jgi:glycosyltransferase involved in cell wall biosynthesis
MTKAKLGFIVPVFHEKDNILPLVKGIYGNVKTPFTLNFIYDLDDDPTIPAIKELQKKYPDIKIIKNKKGPGIINALKTGFEKVNNEYICIMMADLCDNPKDVDKMVKKLDTGADLVTGSRYSRGGKRKGGSQFKAKLSMTGCVLLNLLSGIKTKDATNAFKCFKKDILKGIKIESTGGFELPLEITVKAYKKGYKIEEVPTIWQERIHGKSKFKLIKWFPNYLKWFMYGVGTRFEKSI